MADFFAQVWTAIARRPLTYFLSVISTGLGVAAFLCMLATGESMMGPPNEGLTLPPSGRPLASMSFEQGVSQSGRPSSGPRIDEDKLTELFGSIIKRTTHQDAYVEMWLLLPLKSGRHHLSGSALVHAVPAKLLDPSFHIQAPVVEGRALGPEDYARAAPVCVINGTAADALFVDTNPVGQTVRLGGREYQVVGVEDSGGFRGSATVFVPLTGFAERFRPVAQYHPGRTLWFSSEPASVESDIESIQMAAVRALPGRVRVSIYCPWVLGEPSRKSLHLMRLILGVLGSFLLSVGLLGMVSMLLANLRNRIHEIGLERALGATRLWQAAVLLSEAGIVGLFGGLVGILMAQGLRHVLLSMDIDLKMTLPWLMIALCVSTGSALLAGLIPARLAMKISPAELLRH